MSENIYALYHGDDAAPTIFYIGKCVGPVENRFKQHLRGIGSNDPKEAYEYARQTGVNKIKVVHLGNTSMGTEADFIRQAILEGHRLYNSVAGNSVVAKRPRKTEFAKVNREADERIERRNFLHGKTQALSKSEIVAQRIIGHVPTVTDLMGADWSPTDPGILGQDVQRTGTRAEILRWGDFRFLIAYRPKGKHPDAEVAAVIENTSSGSEIRLSGWHLGKYVGDKKQRMLERLIEVWLDSTIDPWQKPYRGV